MAKEAKMSGREPKKTVDQTELEGLMQHFSSRNEAEDVEKTEQAEIRGKKLEEDRVGGEAIRDAAMKGEKREKKKTNKAKQAKPRGNPLAFLKEINEQYSARREAEHRERLQHEAQLRQQNTQFQEKQTEMQLQVAQVMASAVRAMAKAVEKLN